MKRRIITLFAICVLMAGTDLSAPAAGADKELDSLADRFIPEGSTLEHAARCDMGGIPGGIIFFYKEKECLACSFRGAVLFPDGKVSYRMVHLPPLHQFDNETVDNIRIAAAFFDNADTDADKEVFIITEGYRKGPGGYPLHLVSVMDRVGGSYKSMKNVEKYFGDSCDSAAAIRKKLALLRSFTGSFIVGSPSLSADLVMALDREGNISGTWNAVYGNAHICDAVPFMVEVVSDTGAKLTAWSIIKKKNLELAVIRVHGDRIDITFGSDMADFDCGAGHPGKATLMKKK